MPLALVLVVIGAGVAVWAFTRPKAPVEEAEVKEPLPAVTLSTAPATREAEVQVLKAEAETATATVQAVKAAPPPTEAADIQALKVKIAELEAAKERATLEYTAAKTAIRVEEEEEVPYEVTKARVLGEPGWQEAEITYLMGKTGTSREQVDKWVAWGGEDYARARLVTLSKQ